MAVHVKQNRVKNPIKVSVCLLWMSQLGFAVGRIGASAAYLHDMIVNATGSLSLFISGSWSRLPTVLTVHRWS